MDGIITMLEVVEWLAQDLHYNFRGPTFYSNHLLADRIKDFGSASDDLKEKYYLGWKDTTPPLDKEFADWATQTYDKIVGRNETMHGRLIDAFDMLISNVEIAKREGALPAGIHAVLDDVSSRALTYKFLVKSQAEQA